jgi:hypothetical protein
MERGTERGTDQLYRRPISEPSGVNDEDPAIVAGSSLRPVQKVVTIASIPIIAMKVAVGFGLLLSYAYPIYFFGLTWLLGVGSYAFVLLLFGETEHPAGSGAHSRRHR